jgi:hypothetical protein
VDVYIRAAWRAVSGCDELLILYCGKSIGCISDVMIDIFVITLHVLKRGCVKSCDMTSCDVSRGAATRFEFWIAVKNICRSTDVITEILGRPFTWVDVYIRVAWWAARCREVLWRALNFVKRRKKYMFYCRCNDWTFCHQITWHVTLICTLVWYDELRRATRCCNELCILYIAVKNICCRTDAMIEYFCHHFTWLETWKCTFVRDNELRRALNFVLR